MKEAPNALPVSRDRISYNGHAFHVKIGEFRHARADSRHLHTLLTQPNPQNDSPSHFYQAQCVFYGLKEYKTKAIAKKHLLDAFDPVTKEIAVPPHILAIEEALRDEYEKAKEKNDKQEKRREKAKETAQKKDRKEAEILLKEFADKGIVISDETISDTETDDENPENLRDNSHDICVTSEDLHEDLDRLAKNQLRAVLEKLVSDEADPACRKAAVEEIRAVRRSGRTKSNAAKSKGTRRGSKVEKLSDTSDNIGEYRIVAPYLHDMYFAKIKKMKLRISPSSTGGHLWVWFHFDIVSGIMRSRGTPPQLVGDTARFQWRGREEGEGEMTYEEDNTASITFLGDGCIKGRMRWMGELFEFVGKKMPLDKPSWSRSVKRWKAQYRGINEFLEESEQASWGDGKPGFTWVTMHDSEMSPSSDTSFENRGSDRENDGDDVEMEDEED